jgi:hypothetical protein
MNTTTETRFAVLSIVRPNGRTMRSMVPASLVSIAQNATRTLKAAGNEVSLQWSTVPAGLALDVVNALVAAGTLEGTPVACRLLNNAAGEQVVWLLIETAPGRGYIAAWYPPAARMQVITTIANKARYQTGLKAIRAHMPVEGATITQEWTAV